MIRNSKQREIVLDVINHSCDHPTAYQVYEKAREIIPNISLGTVYRNLSNLVSEGLVKKIGMDEDTCRYDNTKCRHSHFICSECECIIDVFENYFIDVKDIFENIVDDYDISFKGICKKCQGKEDINGTKRK